MRNTGNSHATGREPDYFMTNWDTIVAKHGPAVWGILWRLLADRADVDDCFQETFVAAFKISRRQSVECWPALLCSVATARGLDQLRKRYRQGGRWHDRGAGEGPAEYRLAQVASTDVGPAEHAVAAELSERLRAALSRLPKRQAEMFYLHALCGLSHREIGQRMQMTDNAIAVTIHRARQRLRELLGDCE
jgi:RNA polymerase sigma-70 factor, ECF subfamily